jgi:hypothetical protein
MAKAETERVRIAHASCPEPRLVFALPERLKNAYIRSALSKGKTILEIRWPQQARQGPAEEVTLDKDGLPVGIKAYGARGEVLDETRIEWNTFGALSYPVRIIQIHRSVLNELRTTVSYSGVSLNVPVAGTLFEAR